MKVINVSFDHPMHTLETAGEPASNWPANQKSGFWPKNQHPGNPKRRNTWHPGFGNKPSYQQKPAHFSGHVAEFFTNLIQLLII
ncbi:MAG: hypothetical protein K9K68_01225 [Methylococcaceae bacterium]|nr:hypothetical protein [Methylococcaceae bacterium]